MRVNEREQLFALSRNARYYKRNSRVICTELIKRSLSRSLARLHVARYNER